MRAHIALCVLTLLVERIIERACGDTWRNIRNDLKRIQLGQLSGKNGTVWQVTDPDDNARKHLKKLQIEKVPEVLLMS